ncbi:MAG: CTP synthase, partial [Nitrososphaera sp.]
TPLTPETRRKISLFASVEQSGVISCHDAPSIYKVPEMLEDQGMLKTVAQGLALKRSRPRWADWKKVASSFSNHKGSVRVAVVGKYVTLPDSYVSVYHALSHAGANIGKKVQVDWIDSEKFENGTKVSALKDYDGILAPGGFGKRGSEGIISAANFARENNIPYLGICFGFQLAIVAFARHACGLAGANSTELDQNTKNPIVDFMPEQRNVHDMGGTMRLGGHDIKVEPGTVAHKLYNSTMIRRRHRHRYEFNQNYLGAITKGGMKLSAHSDGGRRMEILEIPGHRFYFAVQYHAEFSSRPGKPEQAFDGFVRAAARS